MASPIILVVDDEAFIRDILRQTLEQNHYTVLTAEDAVQATMLAVKHKPNLIILDIMIPAGGGIAVYNRIKSSALTSHVPVIFLSAAPIEVLRGQIAMLENSIFMSKPWKREELLAEIHNLLKNASPQE